MPEQLKILPKKEVLPSSRGTEPQTKKELQVKGGDGPAVTFAGLLVDLRGNGTNAPSISGLTVESLVPKDDKPQEIGMGSVFGTCTNGICGETCKCDNSGKWCG